MLGDNVFNVFDYPVGFRNLADRLSKITRPEGLFIVRVLCQAQPREHSYQIIEEYKSGQLTDFMQFRYRMMTAGQVSAEQGIYPSKESLDQDMEAHGLCMAEVYERTGYQPPRPPPSTTTSAPMDPYKVTDPTTDEFVTTIDHRFAIIDPRLGTHPLAHRTPVFALARKG